MEGRWLENANGPVSYLPGKEFREGWLRQKSLIKMAVIAVVLTLLAVFAVSATAAGGSLSVSPVSSSVGLGFTTTVDLEITGLSNIQGGDVSVSFDQNILEVEDADGGTSGVQIIEGSCPLPDFVIVNEADNAAGTVDYAAVSTSASCGSGNLASIEFTCIAEGTSPVTITASELSDEDGFLVSHSVVSGQVQCGSLPFQIFMPVLMRES